MARTGLNIVMSPLALLRGYGLTAVCHQSGPGLMRSITSGKIMPHCALLPGRRNACRATGREFGLVEQLKRDGTHGFKVFDVPARAALSGARATGPLPSAIPSPGLVASPPEIMPHSAPGGAAPAGLQVPPSPYRSPDRCAASPPGNYAALRFAPGVRQPRPGYRSTAVCHT